MLSWLNSNNYSSPDSCLHHGADSMHSKILLPCLQLANQVPGRPLLPCRHMHAQAVQLRV